MINEAYGLKLDRVGKIDIGSDVFVGYGAFIMPGVTIGDRVIIGAGAMRKSCSNEMVLWGPGAWDGQKICNGQQDSPLTEKTCEPPSTIRRSREQPAGALRLHHPLDPDRHGRGAMRNLVRLRAPDHLGE